MAGLISRRTALATGAAGLWLPGCAKITGADHLTQSASVQRVFKANEGWTRDTQRLLLSGGQLAPTYRPSQVSAVFKPNGTLQPGGEDYARHQAEGFANWTLRLDGLVAHPLTLSMAQIRSLPARTQITRHDCVEGWSAIGGWTGVPLGLLLKAAQPAPGARYVVFHCADNLDGEPDKGGRQSPGQYYESVGMADAWHPQTLVAYALNGRPLPVPNGAPLRMRIERQLGYKHAKYVNRIEVVGSLAPISGGKGGYWEDRGYAWYAGI